MCFLKNWMYFFMNSFCLYFRSYFLFVTIFFLSQTLLFHFTKWWLRLIVVHNLYDVQSLTLGAQTQEGYSTCLVSLSLSVCLSTLAAISFVLTLKVRHVGGYRLDAESWELRTTRSSQDEASDRFRASIGPFKKCT